MFRNFVQKKSLIYYHDKLFVKWFLEFRVVKVQTEDLMGGEVVEGAYDLMDGNDEVSQGQLHVSVQYVSKQALEEIEAGKEVPRAYFPARENNRLILYQDAETQPMPQVRFTPV